MQEATLVTENAFAGRGVFLDGEFSESPPKINLHAFLHASKDSFLRRGDYLERLCRICFRCRGADPWIRAPVPDNMKELKFKNKRENF